jgi:hypothetical protein
MGNNKREKSLTAIYPTLPKRSLASSKEFFEKAPNGKKRKVSFGDQR